MQNNTSQRVNGVELVDHPTNNRYKRNRDPRKKTTCNSLFRHKQLKRK